MMDRTMTMVSNNRRNYNLSMNTTYQMGGTTLQRIKGGDVTMNIDSNPCIDSFPADTDDESSSDFVRAKKVPEKSEEYDPNPKKKKVGAMKFS